MIHDAEPMDSQVAWWGAIIAQPYFNETFGNTRFITVTGIPYASLSSTQGSIGTVSSAFGVIVGIPVRIAKIVKQYSLLIVVAHGLFVRLALSSLASSSLVPVSG